MVSDRGNTTSVITECPAFSFDGDIHLWLWLNLNVKVSVIYISIATISWNGNKWGEYYYCPQIETSTCSVDWHIYIWLRTIPKVLVKVTHISTANIALMVANRADVTIAIMWNDAHWLLLAYLHVTLYDFKRHGNCNAHQLHISR